MGRIRTIKPEFPQSESVGRLSRDARLLFLQLLTIADDSGRARAASRLLASLLYPYDEDSRGLIESWLDELEREALIFRYISEGDSYLEICNWLKHQKIDRPTPSKIPAPVEVSRGFVEDSSMTRELSPPDMEGKGRDQGRDQGRDASGDARIEIDPSMLASGVLLELNLAGRELRMALEEIARNEVQRGGALEPLKDRMVTAYRKLLAEANMLDHTAWSPLNFFSHGHWEHPENWRRKPGASPPTKREKSEYDLKAEAQLAEQRRRREQLRKEGHVQ